MSDPQTTNTQAPFPLLMFPVVENGGLLAKPWHRFFINVWQRTGGSAPQQQNVVLVQTDATTIAVYQANTGALQGTLTITP